MKRSIISYKNKLNTFDFPCMYCDGSGYVKCRSCKSGCWKCETTLENVLIVMVQEEVNFFLILLFFLVKK